MLHIRSTFYKILLLCAVVTGAEFFLFHRQMKLVLFSDNYEYFFRQNLESIFFDSKINYIFLAGFLILTLILALNGFEFKEKISYTIRRLSIPEKHFLILHGLYNSCAYFIFLIIQIVIIFLLILYYLKSVPDTYYSNQTLFLLFYGNDFLHSLLPLEETVKAVRNVLLIFALGYASAFQSYTQRRRKKQSILLVLVFGTILFFSSSLGSHTEDAFLISASVTCLAIILYNIIRKGDGYAI